MGPAILGTPTLDLHTGGEDHLFPHHECEIAQSEGASGVPLSRYWLHNRFMNIEGRKMSKSLGNFWTLDDLVEKGHDPVAVRYLLLSTHYRSPMNFTLEGVEGAAYSISRVRAAIGGVSESPNAQPLEATERSRLTTIERGFRDALCDDFNTSKALSYVFDCVQFVNARTAWSPLDARLVREIFYVFDSVLDVLTGPLKVPMRASMRARFNLAGKLTASDDSVQGLVDARESARKAKDFRLADSIRKQLMDLGVVVEDTPSGPVWTRI